MTEMQSAVGMLVFPGFHVSSSKIAFDLKTKPKTKQLYREQLCLQQAHYSFLYIMHLYSIEQL